MTTLPPPDPAPVLATLDGALFPEGPETGRRRYPTASTLHGALCLSPGCLGCATEYEVRYLSTFVRALDPPRFLEYLCLPERSA